MLGITADAADLEQMMLDFAQGQLHGFPPPDLPAFRVSVEEEEASLYHKFGLFFTM